MKYILYFIIYTCIFLMLQNALIHVGLGMNTTDILAQNIAFNSYSPFVYIILGVLFFTFPFFGLVSKYKYLLISLWTITSSINLVLLGSMMHPDLSLVVMSIIGDIDLIDVFFYNVFFMIFFSFVFLLLSLKQKSLYFILHSTFFILYSASYFTWYLGIYADLPIFNLFHPRRYDIIYELILIVRGNYLFFSSLVFFYILLNKLIKQMHHGEPQHFSKSLKLSLWMIFGLFGFERLLNNDKRYLFNIQMLSSFILISHYFLINNFYYHFRFNLLYTVFIYVLLILKGFCYLYSLYTIITPHQSTSNALNETQ